MDNSKETIRGIQISARFPIDLKSEWNLCVEHKETLEELSVTSDALVYFRMKNHSFPSLKVLDIYAIGQYKVDYQKRKYGFDFDHIDQSIVEPLEQFLKENTFQALKEVRIHFTPYTNFFSIADGCISHYDKFGAVYDPEYEDELEYLNLDVLFLQREKPKECIDWSFLNELGIETLTLGKTFYSLTKKMEYSFTIQETSLKSIDIETESKKIKEIFSTKYFIEKYFA